MWLWYIIIGILSLPVIFSLLLNIVGIILLALVFGIFLLGWKAHSLMYDDERENRYD